MADVASVRDLNENSPVQMAQVIAELVKGRGLTKAAEITGVPRGRIIRWYKENRAFQLMLEETQTEVVNTIRADLLNDVTATLIDLAPRAAEVMGSMLDDADKDSTRVSAAAHILRLAGFGKAQPTGGPAVENLLGGLDARPSQGD